MKDFHKNKNNFSHFINSIFVFLICLNLIHISSAYTSPSSCNGTTKFYNILTLQCADCPNNKTQVSSFDKTFCNCSSSTYPNWDAIGFSHFSACIDLASAYTKNSQILAVHDQTGKLQPTAVTCDTTISYSKFNQNKCVSCGFDNKLVYSTTLNSCVCSSGYVKIGESCYQNNLSWNKKYTTSDPFNYVAEQTVKIGCQQQNLPQPCNMLINMCARSLYSSSDFYCTLLSTLISSNKSSLPTYKFSSKLTDSIGIYASSIVGTNTTTVKNQINIISIQYDVYGAIRQIAPIDKDLFQCPITDQDVVKFASFGLNLYKTCTSQKVFDRESYYDFFVQTSDGKYAQIPVLISGNYYKRISFSYFPGAYKFNLQFVSQPPLLVPILSVTSSSSSSISTKSNSAETAISPIVPFAIFNVGIFVVFIIIYYRYLQYNPSDDPNDPYFLCKGAVTIVSKMLYTWSYGFWIYLFGLSLYVFCFYKFQQTIYLIMPDQETQWQSYYFLFVIIYYVALILGAISLWTVIYNLGDVDYFLIDWEKQKDTRKFEVGGQRKEVSVWRKVLLVNQLYQLAIHHKINIYFVTLFALLFLKGLEWINLSYSIPNTSNLTSMDSTLSDQNVMLAYFIITFVFFIIALIQLLIRHVIRIWVPLPAENFVDLCAVSNISILIFHQYLHGYYIHGMNPLGQSEGNLQYIENMFQKQSKSFGKSRGFRLEDQDACQTFQAIFPIGIRRAFQVKYKAPLLQKMVPKNYQNQSILSNPLPDDLDDNDYQQLQKISLTMIQSFKMYLQTVKSSLQSVQDRSWWTKFISCPISLQQMQFQKAPIFLKDKWNDFTNAFLSGHEFLFLFNFINWVNLWFIITKNIYFASLVAIIIHQIAFKLPSTFLMKRNISKNTLIDQKFFN